VGPHLVDEHQALCIDAAELLAPQAPQELVSFSRPFGPFFRLLRRRPTSRQTVASLTETPHAAERNSALCEWVAQGRSRRSSKSSFLAFSSSFGFLPGAFLGSKVSRSSRSLQ